MDATSRDALDVAVRNGIEAAIRDSVADGGAGPLTPLSVWSYQGLFDDDMPGRLVQPDERDVDMEQLKDDSVTLQSMYQEAIEEQQDMVSALLAVSGFVWASEPRQLATVLATYDGFAGVGEPNGPSVRDACAALALALQSEFEFPPSLGVHARLSYADAVELAEKQMELKYRTDPQARDMKLLPLTLLREDFSLRVPIVSNKAEEVVVRLLRQMKRCGERLLAFIFSD